MATKEPSANDLNLIGHGTTVEGRVRSQGSVRVDGRVIGEVNAYQAVSIGASGEVEGNISAKSITVGGKVRGNLSAQEKLVFLEKATVLGDIRAAKLVIDEGAVFDGKCSMTSTGASKLAAGNLTHQEMKPAFGATQQRD